MLPAPCRPVLTLCSLSLLAACGEGDVELHRVVSQSASLISAEVSVDKPLLAPIGANQEMVSVASDGAGYLVVWRDFRGGTINEIWASRVSAAGKVLDPGGLLLRKGGASAHRPFIVPGKQQYLVLWEEYRTATGFDILGSRVSTAGTVLDPGGLLVSTATDSQVRPRASFDGAQYFVVWEDRRGGKEYDIYGARVSAAGKVLDPAGVPITAVVDHQKHPSVCHVGTTALVVWDDRRVGLQTDIHGARVSAAGKVLDLTSIVISGAAHDQSAPTVSCDGTGYLTLWQDGRAGGASADIYGARVSAAGKVLDPAGVVVSKAYDGQERPALTWSGGQYLAAWQDRRTSKLSDIHGARITAGGKVLDSKSVTISAETGYQEMPAVAGVGTGYLAVWQDRRGGISYDIYGARVSGAGVVLDPKGFLISMAANVQTGAALAFDGTRHLAAWRDFRSDGDGDLYGVRVTAPAGAPQVVDPSAMALAKAPKLQRSAVVTSDGQIFLLVWQDTRTDPLGDILAARVNGATGQLLDSTPIKVAAGSGAAGNPSAFHASGYFLVVWEDGSSAATTIDVRGARLDTKGAVLDSKPLAISAKPKKETAPHVASDGKSFWVVWRDRRTDSLGDIHGARVDTTGKVLDPAGVLVSGASGAQKDPVAAWSGSNFLVAWQDERPGTAGADIYGARVSNAGKVLDPAGLALSSAPGAQQAPVISSDGQRALVAWQDLRGKTSVDIYGTLVDDAGKLVHPKGLALSAGAQSELAPALSCGGPWNYLLGYHRFDMAPKFGANRVKVRAVSWRPLGGSCTKHTQCQSGHCAGGKCVPLPPDAGPPDLGPPDAGMPDSVVPDLPVADLSPPDLGPPDAAPPADQAPPDQSAPDAGMPEAGAPDLGSPDSQIPDQSRSDQQAQDLPRMDHAPQHREAGLDLPQRDLGAAQADLWIPKKLQRPDNGCDCRTGQSQGSGMGWLLVLGVLLMRRRRNQE